MMFGGRAKLGYHYFYSGSWHRKARIPLLLLRFGHGKTRIPLFLQCFWHSKTRMPLFVQSFFAQQNSDTIICIVFLWGVPWAWTYFDIGRNSSVRPRGIQDFSRNTDSDSLSALPGLSTSIARPPYLH